MRIRRWFERRRDNKAGVDSTQDNDRIGVDAILSEARRRGIPTARVESAEDLMIGLAKIEYEEGRPERAEQILRDIMTAGGPALGLAAANLGILLQDRGDLAGAQLAYRTALTSGEADAEAIAGLNLGLIAIDDGHVVEAERLFRVAAETQHGEASVAGAINLATALERRGANGTARRYYEQVVQSGHSEYASHAAARLAILP